MLYNLLKVKRLDFVNKNLLKEHLNANQSTYCATEYYHVLIITKEVLKHEMEYII